MSPRVVSAFVIRRPPSGPPHNQAAKQRSHKGKINWMNFRPTRTSFKYLRWLYLPSPHPRFPLHPLLDKGGICWRTPPEWAQKAHKAHLRKDGWVEGGMWGGYIVLKVLVSRKRGVGSDLWATLRGWADNCRSLIWVVWGNARLRKGWAGTPRFPEKVGWITAGLRRKAGERRLGREGGGEAG